MLGESQQVLWCG